MTLLLGIDVGTSSTKGVLANQDGDVVRRAGRAHRTASPRPGWFEQDAETIWWREIADVAKTLTAEADGAIGAVCVSGIGPCALPADESGRPLRPAILYGIDTRAGHEIAELNELLGEEAILERCGSPLTSQAIGPKLLWVRNHEPDTWASTRMILMPSSLAVHRLTGEYVLDHHSASQCQPLYDLKAGVWNEGVADQIAPGLNLPRLLWPAEVAGEVTVAASEETGIPVGTPVAAGTIDAWAEAVSVGLRRTGELMLMYGTTMFMIGLADEPRPHPGLWITRWAFPERYSRAAGLATSGAITEWFGALSSTPYEQLEAEAAGVPSGADGLLALPYFAGERTPIFDPVARGVICGLHLGHARGSVYRALLEATAFAVRHNLEEMRSAGDSLTELIAVGGGTRAALWTQIVSDVTGLSQRLPAETVGASYGDALLAAIASGVVGPDEDWNKTEAVVEPRLSEAETYTDLYGRYRELYTATRESAHWLAAFQEAHGDPSTATEEATIG